MSFYKKLYWILKNKYKFKYIILFINPIKVLFTNFYEIYK